MSRYTSPVRPPARRLPATVPNPTVQSPPSTSRPLPEREPARDRVAHRGRRLGHLGRVLCPRLRPVGTPAKLRQVSEIEHVAGGRQPFHQTGLA